MIEPFIFSLQTNNPNNSKPNSKPKNNPNNPNNSTNKLNNGTNGCLKEMPPKDRLLIILRNCFRHAQICTGNCDDVLRNFFIYFMNINNEYKNILNNMRKNLENPITVENQQKINEMRKKSGNQNTNNNNRNNLKTQTTNINNSKTNKIVNYIIEDAIKKEQKENTDKVINLILNHNNKINNNKNNNKNNKTVEEILITYFNNNPDGVKDQRKQNFFA